MYAEGIPVSIGPGQGLPRDDTCQMYGEGIPVGIDPGKGLPRDDMCQRYAEGLTIGIVKAQKKLLLFSNLKI